MALVEVIRVDQVVARLCEFEQHCKQLGLHAQSEGVRGCVALIQEDLKASRLIAEGLPATPGNAIANMAAALVAPRPP